MTPEAKSSLLPISLNIALSEHDPAQDLHIDYGWLTLTHYMTHKTKYLLFEGLGKSLPNSDLKRKRITQELSTILG